MSLPPSPAPCFHSGTIFRYPTAGPSSFIASYRDETSTSGQIATVTYWLIARDRSLFCFSAELVMIIFHSIPGLPSDHCPDQSGREATQSPVDS
ncbi:hypothetical protein RRG08_053057 [Elysia crispata]|uniref:Uncharacterized protein n=1 Tax=Elysia crispata TaxID=231223 RepID=A0AAE0XSR9_9GAST|nr:hypothetical protein RRG08_053057 [Elysia crispata]